MSPAPVAPPATAVPPPAPAAPAAPGGPDLTVPLAVGGGALALGLLIFAFRG